MTRNESRLGSILELLRVQAKDLAWLNTKKLYNILVILRAMSKTADRLNIIGMSA